MKKINKISQLFNSFYLLCFYYHGITPNIKIEFNSFEGLVGCVKAGLCVEVVSKKIIEIIDTSLIDYIELPKEYSMIKTVFIKRNDSADFKALTSFLNIAKKLFH